MIMGCFSLVSARIAVILGFTCLEKEYPLSFPPSKPPLSSEDPFARRILPSSETVPSTEADVEWLS